MVFTVVGDLGQVSIPDWVTDINTYSQWLETEDLPEKARAWWLKGVVWVDLSGEQIFSHVLVKTEFTIVLGTLAREKGLGTYFTDGVLLSKLEADISGKPDGLFLAADALAAKRVRLIEGKEEGYTELQGSPDMVLEVLSKSSEHKDEVLLKQAYWEADIREYWLVDARGDAPRFDLFRHTPRGYVKTRAQQGWVKSNVIGRAFRLLAQHGPAKHPTYTLESR